MRDEIFLKGDILLTIMKTIRLTMFTRVVAVATVRDTVHVTLTERMRQPLTSANWSVQKPSRMPIYFIKRYELLESILDHMKIKMISSDIQIWDVCDAKAQRGTHRETLDQRRQA